MKKRPTKLYKTCHILSLNFCATIYFIVFNARFGARIHQGHQGKEQTQVMLKGYENVMRMPKMMGNFVRNLNKTFLNWVF